MFCRPNSRLVSVPRPADLLVSGAILAFVVILISWDKNGRPQGKVAGPMTWSFTESWAANLNIAGALFQLLIGYDLFSAGLLPTRPTYTLLAVLFAGLAVVAPLVILAFGIPKFASKSETTVTCGVGALSASVALVLSGFAGQALTLFALSLDLLILTDLPTVATLGLAGTWLALLVFGLAHGYKAISLFYSNLSKMRDQEVLSTRLVLP